MIEIPGVIETALAKDKSLDGAVMISLATFIPWLTSSGLPFFPDYTDHGPDHIANVLKTASSLISDEGRKNLTPGDAAVLTLAVLLHDSAMHLSEDGFVALVNSDPTETVIQGFNDKPWPLLWNFNLDKHFLYIQQSII